MCASDEAAVIVESTLQPPLCYFSIFSQQESELLTSFSRESDGGRGILCLAASIMSSCKYND